MVKDRAKRRGGRDGLSAIVSELHALLALETDDLLAQRYERFRVFGRPGAQPVLPSEVTP